MINIYATPIKKLEKMPRYKLESHLQWAEEEIYCLRLQISNMRQIIVQSNLGKSEREEFWNNYQILSPYKGREA